MKLKWNYGALTAHGELGQRFEGEDGTILVLPNDVVFKRLLEGPSVTVSIEVEWGGVEDATDE